MQQRLRVSLRLLRKMACLHPMSLALMQEQEGLFVLLTGEPFVLQQHLLLLLVLGGLFAFSPRLLCQGLVLLLRLRGRRSC